jgi:hypothetical protein
VAFFSQTNRNCIEGNYAPSFFGEDGLTNLLKRF